MKKLILLTSAACFASLNASAFDLHPYITAKAKYAFERNTIKQRGLINEKAKISDNVFGGSFAGGFDCPLLEGNFRFEVEYTKNAEAEKSIKGEKAKADLQAVLFNVYYDFEVPNSFVRPYVSTGMGWGRSEFKMAPKNEKEDSISWQIGTGIEFLLSQNVAFDFGYRYMSYGNFDQEYRGDGIYLKKKYRPHVHELLAGIRYTF